jgi:class 3 adenylate cyclase/tetratricopeptide (TPR) repeat protein
MKCPECQFDNREGAMFCIECGSKLEINCSKCSHLNPPTSKFCEACGSKLNLLPEQAPQELSFEEKITKIQKYLPKGVTEKILAQKDRIEGERKQVTVMFCDLEGFTQLSEKLGPEDAYTIMDQVYEILIHKVHDYEGTVNEMTGDGIMALFGAPIALEDAPQRAIRSAYAIHREMTRFSDKMKEEKEGVPPLKMRIGIHTGPVVVGTLGNDLRVEFKAVGDTVNLASRIENMAEPGATYVTDETYKLTEGFFRFEALGEKKIKGKEGTIKTYRVVAPSTRRTKFDVGAERGLTPFVGRQHEFELLLDGFERAKAGRGQAFSIMAEAGVGKSRLLYEFRKAVTNEDVTFLEGKCLSYSRGVAYYPVTDILKSSFDVREDDGDAKIREKVKRQLRLLKVDEASTLPYLLELLPVKDSGIEAITMSPEARKNRIVEAVKRITLKGSEIRPVVIAIEDLHWIDESSEECLKDLLDSISGASVFLIFTYRPEFVHTWGGRSYHSQVNLNRLSNRESLSMLAYLLETQNIEKNLKELILEKSEGVPFFIEELIKSLKDLKIIEKKDNKYHLAKGIQEVSIPSTIQDVIMARVDTLTEAAKEVLQIGSVIEREFSYELINLVTDITENKLLSQFSVLRDSELLYERGIYPHTTYIFKHALTRDVVYDSILAKRKKKLHGNIGKAIEDLYRLNMDEYYEILAEHYFAGEVYDRAAEFSRLACKKAEKAGALTDAIRCSRKRITSLEKVQLTPEVQGKIISARTTLGIYLFQMFYFSDAKAAIDSVIKLAVSSGNKSRVAQIYIILGAYSCYVEEDIPEALKNLELALKIAEESNDIVSLFFANQFSGIARTLNCEFDMAVLHFNEALDINIKRNAIWGISAVKSSLSYWGYNHQGKIDLGYKTSEEALSIAEESGDIYSKAVALTSHGFSCFYKGYLEKAEQYLLSAVEYCAKIRLFLWEVIDHLFLAMTFIEFRNYPAAEQHCTKALELSDYTDIQTSVLNLIRMYMALTKVMNNLKDIDMDSLYSQSDDNKLKMQEGWIRRAIGQIFLHSDNDYLPEAEEWIKSAIDADERNGVMWNLGIDYTLYAEIFKRKGNQLKAKEKLGKAIEILNECGADGWVEMYKEDFIKLH